MKKINYVGSVLNNTNKIVSNSDADWRGIREGSLIKLQNDKTYYVAAKTEPIFYIKDFEVIDQHNIRIHDNSSVYLIKGDSLTLSYKEYEVLTVIRIIDGGRGYSKDETVLLQGGEPASNIEDGTKHGAHLRITNTKPNGAITGISLENKGKYIVTPSKIVNLGGSVGMGASLEVEYKLLESRALLERDVDTIEISDKTTIRLSYIIPVGIKEGKLSTKKSVLILTSNYVGKTQHGALFDVARDFTPNYGWPLLVQNSFAMETIFNQVVSSQDRKIKELEDRINQLEKPNN